MTERTFILHQADQSRVVLTIVEEHLEAIRARLARVPTRVEVARTALIGMIGGVGMVILWIEVFWRHHP
jgi:hypothetical protein